jgi:hypothetical protein
VEAEVEESPVAGMMEWLRQTRRRLTNLATTLVDQRKAQVLIPANAHRPGFWFGAGNVIQDPRGAWYLVGRYRNEGDSRTGVGKGERGLELAVFRSTDGGNTFSKALSLRKADLNMGAQEVVSIEGAKLHVTQSGVELFVSTEKSGIGYPPGLESYLKPGTGVWTIDRLQAPTVEELAGRTPRTLLRGTDPRWFHLKDPVVFDAASGETILYFCTHPYNWSSSNSAFAARARGSSNFAEPDFQFFPRGFTWDAAISRVTEFCAIPAIGGIPPGAHLVFYDGGETIRPLEEHSAAVSRPRGHSCEELGGLGVMVEPRYGHVERLSLELPLFVSPHGTGSCRYVNVLETAEGYLATWQQSQSDGSQPLVAHFLSRAEAEGILRG